MGYERFKPSKSVSMLSLKGQHLLQSCTFIVTPQESMLGGFHKTQLRLNHWYLIWMYFLGAGDFPDQLGLLFGNHRKKYLLVQIIKAMIGRMLKQHVLKGFLVSSKLDRFAWVGYQEGVVDHWLIIIEPCWLECIRPSEKLLRHGDASTRWY